MQTCSHPHMPPADAVPEMVAWAIVEMIDWIPPGQPDRPAGGLLIAIQMSGRPLDLIPPERLAHQRGDDVIVACYDPDPGLATPISFRIGIWLPSRLLWQRDTYRLWAATETDAACLISADPDVTSYFAMEASRLDAGWDLPCTTPAERRTGLARATARFRRLMAEG